MIARSNATSLRPSSVAFVATQGIWLETVPIDNVEPIGAMGPLELYLVALLLDASVAVMLLIRNTR